MDINKEIYDVARKIVKCRAELVNEYPFFGRLLLNLNPAFDDCGTAYTDGERVVVDLKFATRISDIELKFVLLHEILHIILKHCTRHKSYQQNVYNLACDIYVNSCILQMTGKDEFSVDGNKVMHTLPDGSEGSLYTTEEIYAVYMKLCPDELNKICQTAMIDSHSEWNNIEDAYAIEEKWNIRIRSVISSDGYKEEDSKLNQRIINSYTSPPQTDWREILHRFMKHCRADYTFLPPDRRFSGSDFILPSFCQNISGYRAENIWFLVDTSGSVDNKDIELAYSEIKNAIYMTGELSGYISFFDHKVYEPVKFDTVDSLEAITPVGGGGTDFYNIFKSIDIYFKNNPPKVIIIITDGMAKFPPEKMAQGIPVVWIISGRGIRMPWGKEIRIQR